MSDREVLLDGKRAYLQMIAEFKCFWLPKASIAPINPENEDWDIHEAQKLDKNSPPR